MSRLSNGYIFPRDMGYFTPEGLFTFVLKEPNFNRVEKQEMWSAALLSYDPEHHRIATTPEGLIRVFRGDNLNKTIGLVTPGNVRNFYAYESGETVVSPGGFILPPSDSGDYCIVGDSESGFISSRELLSEITKGMLSKYRGSGRRFACVQDISLTGEPVTLINLKSPSHRDDIVVLRRRDKKSGGKLELVDRKVVFPFIGEVDFKMNYEPGCS